MFKALKFTALAFGVKGMLSCWVCFVCNVEALGKDVATKGCPIRVHGPEVFLL